MSDDMLDDMRQFDWSSNYESYKYSQIIEEPYLMFLAPQDESRYDRRLRMLQQVRRACMACDMCELGRHGVSRYGVNKHGASGHGASGANISDGQIQFDPHVFSSMTPTRFMVVGQNPGWTEVCKCEPFVGD